MHILLVEDEKALSRALCAMLDKNGHTADPVYDGISALEYLSLETYDLVILDLMLPKMNGMSVLRTIREEGNSVPVLILSAKSEVEDKVEGLDLGANDYLTKPFATAELLARVRALTRKETAHITSDMKFGNITLSTSSHTLSSPYGSHVLTNREYRMMELLIRNPSQLITTDTIIERVWGYDSDTSNNVIWVYVSYLRKKLNSLQADIEIHAARNTGYSLVRKS